MLRRRLPGTDLELSVVGFGCWAIGGLWWGDDVRDDHSERAIRAALDVGIDWFDTAPIYGWGHADTVLARALGPDRARVVIATKVGARRGDDGHAVSDLTPAHIARDVDASLARLGVDRLDLAQLHWPCQLGTPIEDSVGALVDLVAQGKVRYFGLCNYDAEGLRRACAAGPVVSLQTPYSLLRRELEQGLGGAAHAAGVGVLAYEPLCRGLLSGKFHGLPHFPESDLRARDERFQGHRFLRAAQFVRILGEAASRLSVPTAALAIGWVAAQPGITAVLAGAKTEAQVRENARAASLVGRERLWEAMRNVAGAWRG